MSPTSPAVAASPSEALPVQDAERLPLLDALRGFALLGVFISNTYMWFSGRFLLTREQMEATMAQASVLDTVVARTTGFLIFGKFITLFAFLFGLGFAVQMGRAEQRGASIVPLYARRMGVLLAIGCAHLFLLWFGDILTTYAVLGFALLLFRRRSNKTVFIWSVALIMLAPLLTMGLPRLQEILASPEAAQAMAKAAREKSEALKLIVLTAFRDGGYFDVVRANAIFYMDFIKGVLFSLPAILGRFLLGFAAGRSGIFQDPAQHRPFFRKLLIWGLVAGVIGNGTSTVLGILFLKKVLNPDTMPWLPVAMTPVRQFAEVGLAAFYVAAITLLFQRATWQRLLSVLAPVGRMALSNYLTQTVLSISLYYGLGLGLLTTLGPKALVGIPVGIFVLQIGLSHWWLSRFRFGPAEWVWRSLTYGKAQPMRRAPVEAPAPVAAV
jgi:uncharacterized protein